MKSTKCLHGACRSKNPQTPSEASRCWCEARQIDFSPICLSDFVPGHAVVTPDMLPTCLLPVRIVPSKAGGVNSTCGSESQSDIYSYAWFVCLMKMTCKNMLWNLIKLLKTNQTRFMNLAIVCVFAWAVGARILSHRQTHKLQHTQSCVSLRGETNPVTVSGNVSAPARCNLDSAEGESPRLQNQCFFSLLSIFCLSLSFILSTSGTRFSSLSRADQSSTP